ncbi:MAG: zinc ribbon domain-containing protein [Chloroflexi bacterium]|nr:zinc ribbon domain-containing protein [Chloroflexota bacterium]
MPIYEYRCQDCKRRVSIFWRTFSEAKAGDKSPVCPRCGESNLTRLMSRVRVIRSEESRMDAMSDMDFSGLDENDPKSMGRWMRKMSAETGEDLGPEFDEVVGRLESGEDPEEIEKSMPDMMGAGGDDAPYGVGGGMDF